MRPPASHSDPIQPRCVHILSLATSYVLPCLTTKHTIFNAYFDSQENQFDAIIDVECGCRVVVDTLLLVEFFLGCIARQVQFVAAVSVFDPSIFNILSTVELARDLFDSPKSSPQECNTKRTQKWSCSPAMQMCPFRDDTE